MGITDLLTAQGVEPTGRLGRLVARVMPLLFHRMYRTLARLLDLRAGDEVLDIGCGSGVFLSRYASGAARIAGLDHSGVQIQLARRRLRQRIAAGTAEIVQGDSAALPWENDRFTAVTSNCLGCFSEPARSLTEMYRVLRPGGRVGLGVDFYPDGQEALKAERRWGLPTWDGNALTVLMSEAGFSRIRVSHDRTTTYAIAVKDPPLGDAA